MLLETLERTLRAHAPPPLDTLWVVAVSGGADSLALLHALVRLQPRFGYRLHVATLDHKLRLPGGAEDVQFVRQISDEWGVSVTAASVDVLALAAEQRLSLEAAARLARYRFLAEVAHSVGASRIATAHNADDQAETVLMHILRGAGLAGLGGMRFAAPLFEAPDLTLVRPLLAVPRAEVEAYCAAHALQPRVDETNRDVTFLRNRLRHEVMPLLRQINPQVARQLRQLADASVVDAGYIEEAVQRDVFAQAVLSPDAVVLPLAVFRAVHPALQRRFVVWAARALDPTVELAYVQQVEAVALAMSGQVGAQTTLPATLSLRVDYETVVIERANARLDTPAFALPPGHVLEVALPGVTDAGSWVLTTGIVPASLPAAQAVLTVPEGAQIRLRTRQPGDRFAPLGLDGHSQKLKEWLIDHKVPQRWRDHLPLLEVDGEIAALVLGARWPVSNRFAVRSLADRQVAFWAAEKAVDNGR